MAEARKDLVFVEIFKFVPVLKLVPVMEELAFVWVAEIGQLVAPDSHGLLLILLLL